MNQPDQCITKCYKNDINNPEFGISHPFMGVHSFQNDNFARCANKYYNKNMTAKCDKNTVPQINIENALNVPIHPTNYLSLYYNIHNISDVIRYIRDNPELMIQSRIRLIDFALLSFSETFDDDVDKWLLIIHLLFPNDNVSDDIIIKIFKKIFKAQEIIAENYPFHFLPNVNKYLKRNLL